MVWRCVKDTGEKMLEFQLPRGQDEKRAPSEKIYGCGVKEEESGDRLCWRQMIRCSDPWKRGASDSCRYTRRPSIYPFFIFQIPQCIDLEREKNHSSMPKPITSVNWASWDMWRTIPRWWTDSWIQLSPIWASCSAVRLWVGSHDYTHNTLEVRKNSVLYLEKKQAGENVCQGRLRSSSESNLFHVIFLSFNSPFPPSLLCYLNSNLLCFTLNYIIQPNMQTTKTLT